jgi:2-hydroxymethylglutarate dehydrogenase
MAQTIKERLLMKKIGFIGIGTMGKPMARNLLEAGFALTICSHQNMDPVRELAAEGAQIAASPQELAAASEIIVLCLPDSPQVEEVVAGPRGVLAGAAPGSIIVDTSTILPATTQKMAQLAAQKSVHFIDAPMSGGQAGAIAGTLTFMCGGDEATLNQVRPVLEAMGKRTFHVGGVGAGEVVKICNNLMLGINIVAAAEAFTLGVKAGVRAEALREVISASSGYSAVLDRYLPHTILKNQYEPGFMLDLMCKDIGLALGAAKSLGVPLLEGAVATQVLELLRDQGHGQDDFTVVATFYEEAARVSIATGERRSAP